MKNFKRIKNPKEKLTKIGKTAVLNDVMSSTGENWKADKNLLKSKRLKQSGNFRGLIFKLSPELFFTSITVATNLCSSFLSLIIYSGTE